MLGVLMTLGTLAIFNGRWMGCASNQRLNFATEITAVINLIHTPEMFTACETLDPETGGVGLSSLGNKNKNGGLAVGDGPKVSIQGECVSSEWFIAQG